ncbi:MAG: hypothetical protein ACLS8R_05845 [Anaeromassilibacillus sp.]
MEKLSNDELAQRCHALEENLKRIRAEIAEAAVRSGRKPEDITLLAATKTVPVEVINHGIELGLDHIGENRVQELCDKYDALSAKPMCSSSAICRQEGEVSDREGQHDPVGGQHEAGAGDFPVERPGTSNNGRPGGGQHRPGGEQIGVLPEQLSGLLEEISSLPALRGARIDGDPASGCR